MTHTLRAVLAAAFTTLGLLGHAQGQEATIRKNLAERLPNLPKIEEVSKTPMAGLYEVRVNQSDIFYTDSEGQFLIQGVLIDTKARANLTEQRVEKLSATPLAFDSLPLTDAFTTVRGNGKHKIAVFSDPNCGFCKRQDRDMAKLTDVTIYTFLIDLLGPDSKVKAGHIWCAKDRAATYTAWMVNGTTPPAANCDTAAIERNREFARRNGITGTPTSFLADGTRIRGADFKRIEQALTAAR